MTHTMTKAFRVILIIAFSLQLTAGFPQAALATEPPPLESLNPDEGPMDGIERESGSFYNSLSGDHPVDPDWYQLPPTAFSISEDSILADGILQVVGGLSHTCALTTTGGVKCWGDNWEGKLGDGSVVNSYTPVDVVGLTSGVTNISSSHKHTCALTESGGMKCWGRNWHGELGDGSTAYRVTPVDVQGLTSGVKGIAVGGFHTCALLNDGSMKCWGANWHGQLGDDTKEEKHLPVDVVGLAGPVKAISAGKYHTCALLESGAVQCWGYNLFGQLGNNSQIDRPVPQDVYWLSANVQAITAGENHSCALTTSGIVMCWGNNADGQLGNGSTEISLIPIVTAGLEAGNQAIQAGMRFTCVITAYQTVKCWGENWAGQLGNGTQIGQLTPVDVVDLSYGANWLGAGDSHTCAVQTTQGLVCWGSNGFGQLGNGESALRLQPVSVFGLDNDITSIVSGGSHSCALTASGGVKCWGNNEFGQLGNNTTIDSLTPVNVSGLDSGVTAIAAGGAHTCAAYRDDVYCWGYNAFGQVGDGSRVNRLTPVPVVGIDNPVSFIAAGANHTCALMEDSELIKCWGQNKNGQLGNGSKVDSGGAAFIQGVDGLRFSSLTAGERHTCAATLNGNVFCWGFNEDGQLGNGTVELSTLPVEVLDLYKEVAKVSAGMSHSCALTYDGHVKCWGDNTYGQVGDGSTYRQLTPVETIGLGGVVSQLAAGGFHTCVKLSDGSGECWGNNQAGQLGDGTTFMRLYPGDITGVDNPIRQLTGGLYTTCMVTSEGSAKCWGLNANGQIGDGSEPWVLTPGLVIELITTSLSINYTDGQPGSYFTILGKDFPPEVQVIVKVNNQELSPPATSDQDGSLLIILDTSLAESGSYVVTLTSNRSFNICFSLDTEAPYRDKEDIGIVYQVPSGIAMTYKAFLPSSYK